MRFLLPTAQLCAASLFVLLSGCSSISQQECALGDWYSIGVNDGKSGAAINKFRNYQRDCAEHGYQADFQQYETGYQQGLVFYCDFNHGEAHGRSGASYNQACSGHLEPQFRQGYEVGRRWYQAKSTVDKIDTELGRLDQNLRTLQQDIQYINQQIAQEQDPAKRASLLYRADQLRLQVDQINTRIGQLQVEYAQASANLHQLEAKQQ